MRTDSAGQQSHESQLTVLRRFARQVEHHLEQLQKGAAPPGYNRQLRVDESRQGASQVYVPGASASSSAVPLSSVQMPTPPTVSPPPIPTPKDEVSSQKESASLSSTHARHRTRTHFSTVVGQVRAGAIRMDIIRHYKSGRMGRRRHCCDSQSRSKEGARYRESYL